MSGWHCHGEGGAAEEVWRDGGVTGQEMLQTRIVGVKEVIKYWEKWLPGIKSEVDVFVLEKLSKTEYGRRRRKGRKWKSYHLSWSGRSNQSHLSPDKGSERFVGYVETMWIRTAEEQTAQSAEDAGQVSRWEDRR